MTKRLNFLTYKNAGMEGLVAVETWLAESFDRKLLELVKVRVSQMNGCAHCLHMHRHDALKQGETEDRLLLLSAWRESGLYTERERAALAWAEALTRIAESRAADAVYEEARSVFSDDELVALSSGWSRSTPGTGSRSAFACSIRRTASAPPEAMSTVAAGKSQGVSCPRLAA